MIIASRKIVSFILQLCQASNNTMIPVEQILLSLASGIPNQDGRSQTSGNGGSTPNADENEDKIVINESETTLSQESSTSLVPFHRIPSWRVSGNATSKHILIGTRVFGSHGELRENPNPKYCHHV